MNNFVGVVLAAGNGTRMKSNTPKMLHKIFDKTMLLYSVQALAKAGAEHIVIVTGYKQDIVKKEIHNWNLPCKVSTVNQAEQLGTGHAVKMAMEHFGNGNVVVMYGDTPLITSNTVATMVASHVSNNRQCTLVSTLVDNPTGYGRIIRENGNNSPLSKIVEQKDATPQEARVNEINPGLYCYGAKELTYSLERLSNNNAAGEYYLTDTIEILKADGHSVDAVIDSDSTQFFGVNNRVQLAEATKVMQQRINQSHMIEGVTIVDPSATYIGDNVKIGADTIIHPGCTIEGNTTIGEGCTIGPHTIIKNSSVGYNTTIESSKVDNATIGNDANIGPFAHLRPLSDIGNKVRLGNFTEIKKSKIGDGSKVSHLSYVGDATVGNDVNIGCGVVTVNYDGKNKFNTTIEDGAFIGCNANLVAPVSIQKGAYVAAGTTIVQDVPNDALAIGRARQENKLNWGRKNN